jgi:DNA-binding PadR family transcriptional regulator
MPTLNAMDPKRFYILLALTTGHAHGYLIERRVREESKGAVYLSFTSLYRLLKSLEKANLIEDRGNLVYALTGKGRARLKWEAGHWQDAAGAALRRLG